MESTRYIYDDNFRKLAEEHSLSTAEDTKKRMNLIVEDCVIFLQHVERSTVENCGVQYLYVGDMRPYLVFWRGDESSSVFTPVLYTSLIHIMVQGRCF